MFFDDVMMTMDVISSNMIMFMIKGLILKRFFKFALFKIVQIYF